MLYSEIFLKTSIWGSGIFGPRFVAFSSGLIILIEHFDTEMLIEHLKKTVS